MIDRVAGAIKATNPAFRYQPIADPEELGKGGRLQWVSGCPGGAPAYAGTDFRIGKRREEYFAVNQAGLLEVNSEKLSAVQEKSCYLLRQRGNQRFFGNSEVVAPGGPLAQRPGFLVNEPSTDY
jgi:hypothetical protein